MTQIINLIGAPGSGKSTSAAGLFHLMKIAGKKVELITEFPKDLVYEERNVALKSQAYIFGEQEFRQFRLLGKVDYIITDSPLILSPVYSSHYPASFKQFAVDIFNSYKNLNFYIRRVKKYVQIGRNQSAEESDDIAFKILAVLVEYNVPFITLDGDDTAPKNILDIINTSELVR